MIDSGTDKLANFCLKLPNVVRFLAKCVNYMKDCQYCVTKDEKFFEEFLTSRIYSKQLNIINLS